MEIKIFDVVKLKTKDKATILNIANKKYLVEITNPNGKSKGTREISNSDIEKIVFKKGKERI